MITLSNINKTYHKNGVSFQALKNLNLHVAKGTIIGVIGQSGAGKSSLLRTINLLERPEQGEVLIDDVDLCTLSASALNAKRQQIGMIFQHFNLIQNKTVFENIALPLRLQNKDGITKRVNELLALVELSDKANDYPNALSGGQKQRVAIARSLTTQPKLLLCDEATSALDPETTASILALLKKINHDYGITIVLVTHEMDVIKQLCQQVAVIKAGQIQSLHTIKDLLNTADPKHLFMDHLRPELPDYLKKNLRAHYEVASSTLLQLQFYGDTTNKPLVSQLSRELSIDMNILQANIDEVAGSTFGLLLIKVNVDKKKLAQLITELKQQSVQVEIIGYVR